MAAHHASSLEILKLLLSKGAGLKVAPDEKGGTVLANAAESNDTAMVRFLIEKGGPEVLSFRTIAGLRRHRACKGSRGQGRVHRCPARRCHPFGQPYSDRPPVQGCHETEIVEHGGPEEQCRIAHHGDRIFDEAADTIHPAAEESWRVGQGDCQPCSSNWIPAMTCPTASWHLALKTVGVPVLSGQAGAQFS